MKTSDVKNTVILSLGLIAVMAMIPDLAAAGGSGGPLNNVYSDLVTWTQGSVGKVISIAMIIVGMAAGVVRQSIMSFAVGAAAGLGLYNAPNVIDELFSASILAATAAPSTLDTILKSILSLS